MVKKYTSQSEIINRGRNISVNFDLTVIRLIQKIEYHNSTNKISANI